VSKPILPMAATNPAVIPTTESRRSSEDFVVGVALGPDSDGSFDHLHATYANLRKTGRRTKLVIFGLQDVRHLCNKSALEGLGPDPQWVSDESSTRDLLQACDVLVSLQDGVPLLVLRAISSRLPVITTAVRVPEAIRNQRTVEFIRQGDQHGLQEALLPCLSSRDGSRLLVLSPRRASRNTIAIPICGARMFRPARKATHLKVAR